MPGGNSRATEKAKTLQTDCVVMDLEDATAPDMKETARKMACEAVDAGGYGMREVVIRVNPLETPWGHDDVVAVSKSKAKAIVLPKVESAADVNRVEELMEISGAPDDMGIWCLLETPFGILRAEEIAAASRRMKVILIGMADLSKELRCPHTTNRDPFVWSLGMCLLAARAYGLDVIDGIYPDMKDDDGFLLSCQQARALGYDGKTLIHPRTIEAANSVFGPTSEEIDRSHRIIDAYEKAVAEGAGVAVVDNKLVENLHVEQARRMLRLAEMIDTIHG